MERPKYSQDKSIPAVELSLRPLEVDSQTAGAAQKEPEAPPPIHVDGDGSDATQVEENGLRVISERPARAE